MNRRRCYLLALSLLLALIVPATAIACPIAFRTIGPVDVRSSEVLRPSFRSTNRAAWKLGSSWSSTRPELNQTLRAKSGRAYHAATYPSQRALSIDAVSPGDGGWRYGDDDDPATPPCALTGRGEWQPPVILVKEERRRVRIMAVAQRTVGDRTGCELGADGVWGCPVMTRTVVRLARPIGTRRVDFEVF